MIPPTPRPRPGVGLVALIFTVGGVALIVVGLDLHFSQSTVLSLCHTQLGQIGQDFISSARSACSRASTKSVEGVVLAIVGGVVILVALRIAFYALAAPKPDHTVASDSG